ncbi:hypothetical protein NC651_038445 [Populus alba x Populus x berolinensis]|nr:hypothetical protein NC651_038445 [Populus alba x Populus x berolinensis]
MPGCRNSVAFEFRVIPLEHVCFCYLFYIRLLPQTAKRFDSLVSPGAWLCDLTLERYEVREKKITKKRPRGLKAMGNVDSDSE